MIDTARSDAPRPALAVRALACRRGGRALFSGLSFEARGGELLWLRGANGRGKTSLLRLLAGLSTPEAGTIEHGTSDRLYLAHANALKDDLSARESLHFLARLQGLAATAGALDSALDRFGLAARRTAPVRTLSQGQRRRVALARLCLAPQGALWLLDEPFDALDADGVGALANVLTEHAAGGGCTVLTSHLPLPAEAPMASTLSLDHAVAA